MRFANVLECAAVVSGVFPTPKCILGESRGDVTTLGLGKLRLVLSITV